MHRLAVDTRALAIFRIALGLLLLASLAQWLADFRFFFTATGPLPPGAMVADTITGKDAWSLYYASSYSILPYVLFASTVLATLLVIVGWRCEVTSPLLFLLFLSLQNRASVALDDADRLLLVGLLYGVFLPWNCVYSLSKTQCGSGKIFHSAALGLGTIQLCSYGLLAFYRWKSDGFTPGLIPLLLGPLLLLCTYGQARNLVVVILGLYGILGPEAGIASGTATVGLLIWLQFQDESGGQSLSLLKTKPQRMILAVGGGLLLMAGALLVTDQPDIHKARAFAALGPRASEVSPEAWYVVVAVGRQGQQWDVHQPDREPDFRKPAAPFLAESYRKRLYLGGLDNRANWGLPYWLAIHYYGKERERAGDSVVRVEVRQCRVVENGSVTNNLLGRWPLAN